MAEMGWTPDDLDEVLLAGSFGSYINPASARAIGLVPWVPVERIVAVGNAAGEGAKISLLSFREREAANRLPDFIEYLELSGRPEFNDIFMDVLAFPQQATRPGCPEGMTCPPLQPRDANARCARAGGWSACCAPGCSPSPPS